MAKQIEFTKLVAAGNDFVLIEKEKLPLANRQLPELAKRICERRFAVGADGLLIVSRFGKDQISMRIFNPDGSEPQMCANASRCVALWQGTKQATEQGKILKIKTPAGEILAITNKDQVKIKLTNPRALKLGIPLKLNQRSLRLNFINSGVPHAVIFVQGLEKIAVVNLGRQIRWHRRFRPQGTNVDFVEILDDNNIKIRTYERGVEDETLACGTGVAAAALILAACYELGGRWAVNVYTRSGEVLKVEFKRKNNRFRDVWLEGKAGIVYRGVYYVK